MPQHGLLQTQGPPSKDLLKQWLIDRSISFSDGVEITEMEDGEGWRLSAIRDIDVGEVLCRVPKTSILSVRTSSLPPLPSSGAGGIATNHTILRLALALLHELRLAEESPFWGYIQSLPRKTVLVPLVWEVEEICGEDGRKGLEWLRGTEAERDIRHREEEGLALADLEAFYAATSSILPPTLSHPNPSPFSAFLHAYSLISTRAFLIDLYHLIALTPFCDILNHSSTPHTSLQSDDFVCHKCGSLRTCTHDIPSTTGITRRLQHLGEADRRKLEEDVDTVDMVVERWVGRGEEVFNSYGEGLGDARLLVEWGFLEGDFVGKGLIWEIEELSGDEQVQDMWSELEGNGGLSSIREEMKRLYEDGDEDEDRLIAHSTAQDTDIMSLNNDGRISSNLYAFLYITNVSKIAEPLAKQVREILESCRESIKAIEESWSSLTGQHDANLPQLDSDSYTAVKAVIKLLDERIKGLYRSDLNQDDIFQLRDALAPGDKLQVMGMTLSINERILLETTREKWVQLLDS